MAVTWLLKAKHNTKETDADAMFCSVLSYNGHVYADAITTNDDSDWNRPILPPMTQLF